MSAWGMSIAHRSDGLEATMIRFTKSSKDDLLRIDALVKQSEKRIRQGLNPPPKSIGSSIVNTSIGQHSQVGRSLWIRRHTTAVATRADSNRWRSEAYVKLERTP